MTSKTAPETTRRTFMNSNGRWYSVALMPDGVRISRDFDDKKKAQEVADADPARTAGVLTHIKYENITDVFHDRSRKSITLGTKHALFVLPGWQRNKTPIVKIARAGWKSFDEAEHLFEEHDNGQPVNVFMKHISEHSGLVCVTESDERLHRFERPGSAADDQHDPTKPVPTVWSTWQMARAIALIAVVALLMANDPEVRSDVRLAAVVASFLVGARLASIRVKFEDDAIVVRNGLTRRRIPVSQIKAFTVRNEGGSWPLRSRNIVVAKTGPHKWRSLRATLVVTSSKAARVSDSVGAFAERNQIPNSVRPDHLSPFLRRGDRKLTKAGVNLRSLTYRR